MQMTAHAEALTGLCFADLIRTKRATGSGAVPTTRCRKHPVQGGKLTLTRIPPIQCLVTFEALARLRSVTRTSEELCVTVSAVSHRVRQLEDHIGLNLFGRDF